MGSVEYLEQNGMHGSTDNHIGSDLSMEQLCVLLEGFRVWELDLAISSSSLAP